MAINRADPTGLKQDPPAWCIDACEQLWARGKEIQEQECRSQADQAYWTCWSVFSTSGPECQATRQRVFRNCMSQTPPSLRQAYMRCLSACDYAPKEFDPALLVPLALLASDRRFCYGVTCQCFEEPGHTPKGSTAGYHLVRPALYRRGVSVRRGAPPFTVSSCASA
jgi:hypothetical protein